MLTKFQYFKLQNDQNSGQRTYFERVQNYLAQNRDIEQVNMLFQWHELETFMFRVYSQLESRWAWGMQRMRMSHWKNL